MDLNEDMLSFDYVEESSPNEKPLEDSALEEPPPIVSLQEDEDPSDTSDFKFKELVFKEISDPNYDTLTQRQKIDKLYGIYKSRQWEDAVTPVLKSVATSIWNSAEPEDLPNLAQEIGAPPFTETDQNVDESLSNWKIQKIQELDERGLIPEIYGDQLDKYFDRVTNAEKDAYTARNRSTANWALNRFGNYIREGTKGAASLATDALAGAIRLGGAPFGKGQETADYISSIPEMVLGTPANDFLYTVDENGYPVQNPDGTFQTHWQAQAAQIVGGITGMIGTLGVGAVAGVSSKALAAANVTVDSLGMANQSFKTVYDETGSVGKAYTAAAFTLPAAAIGAIGEAGIVAGKFRQTLTSLTKHDQARYIAGALAKNTAIGAASNAAADIVQQTGEVLQTGEEYSGERTTISTVAGAVGSGVVGTGFDYIVARTEYNKGSILRAEKINKAADEAVNFVYGLNSETIATSAASDFPSDIINTLGIRVVSNPDGTTTLTKSTDLLVNENAELPILLQTLEDQPTPREIKSIAQSDPVLAAKLGRPEHVNNIRATEAAIAKQLETDPGLLPVRFLPDKNAWENVETGALETYLKDLLHPESPQTFERDLSDISDVPLIDADLISTTDLETLRTETEQSLLKSSEELSTLTKIRKEKEGEITKAKATNKEIVALEKKRSRLTEQLSQEKKSLEALGKDTTTAEPSREATKKTEDIKNRLDVARAKVLDLQNEKASAPKADRPGINKKLEIARAKTRLLQSELLQLRKQVKAETDSLQAFKEAQKSKTARKRIQDKIDSIKSRIDALGARKPVDLVPLQKDITDISSKIDTVAASQKSASVTLKEIGQRIKSRDATLKKVGEVSSKGFGAVITKGNRKEIIIPSGLPPRAKESVIAHEYGHVLSDRIKLSPEENLALDSAVTDINIRALDEPANQLADSVFLPEVRNIVVVPEGKMLKELDADSKNALTSKREFLANQLGAIILKRSGKDIGDYKIIPEIESAVANIKLPLVGEGNGKINKPSGVEEAKTEVTQERREGEQSTIGDEGATRREDVTTTDGDYSVKGATGEKGETAYSETIRNTIPDFPVSEYPKWARVRALEDALTIVDTKGIDTVIRDLSNEAYLAIDPLSRVALTEAVLKRASEAADADPSEKNINRLFEATQMRASVGTVYGQALSMLQRVRGTETFGDFLVQLKKEYEAAGVKAPEFTDYQLKELKILYSQTKNLPPGVLQNNYVMKLMEKSLRFNKIEWPEFFKSMIRTNLLSGIGTPVINAVGGVWMAPITTALANPLMGGGLLWKAIFKSLPIAKTQAKLIFEGKAGNTLAGGLIDPTPLRVRDYSTPARYLATLYNKFGNKLFHFMQAADAFNRAIAFEQNIARKKLERAKKLYGNNPEKFNAETSKILLNPEDIKANIRQAEREGAAAGVTLSDADKYARAYEILRQRDTPVEMLMNSEEWTNSVSLRGNVVNPTSILFNNILTAWERSPLLAPTSHVIVPFGRSMIRLSDYALDFVPGNIIIDKLANFAGRPPRSEAMRDRLIMGQKVGVGLTLGMMALAQAGAISITGDDEIVLDRGGEGDSIGKKAKTGAQFSEAAQKKLPPYSIILPGGVAISYRDLPGFNVLMYGIYRVNKNIDTGMNPALAGVNFFRDAYVAAIPILGGLSSLSSPYTKLINDLRDPNLAGNRIGSTLQQLARTASRQITPFSSLLNDTKNVFDNTPEETYQSIAIQMVSGIPGAETLFGSKPALNYFGEPVEIPFLERAPGIKRILSSKLPPSDEVALKAFNKGLIIPEVNKRAVNFKKSFFGAGDAGDIIKERYKTTYEERTGNAFTGSLTPDEWYAFTKATGPYIKRLTNQFASSAEPLATLQPKFNNRVHAIRDQAMKNYIRTGKF